MNTASTLRLLEPAPASAWLDRLMRSHLFALLAPLRGGVLKIRDTDGTHTFGAGGPSAVEVTIRDTRTYRGLLDGSVGIADAYARGHWSADDLPALVRLLARNADVLAAVDGGLARLVETARHVVRSARPNSRSRSRRHVEAHYDLSNELFRVFLDPTMTYSSGIFRTTDVTLEEAQIAKLDAVCRKLDLTPDDHVLEIGAGWGSFAIYAARTYGCRVTTTTLSKTQLALATELVRAAGLSDRVTVLGSDYRDLHGAFSKLASIEMIEAVGHELLPRYFRACAERLAPGGAMVLQAITIAEPYYARHLVGQDFIKARIFPGSSIPSLGTIVAESEQSGLRVRGVEDLTTDYALTLRHWRSRLLTKKERVRELGFDEAFIRGWDYYFAYCEGAFSERYIGAHQIEMVRS